MSISQAPWKRPGTTRARDAPMAKTSTRTPVMMSRTIMMRFISNGVPTQAKPSGKKSEIDGGSKPSREAGASAPAR